jgi:transcriptional regulator with XRE-family HTH domain
MPHENFPELLKVYRKTMGWTQAELARRWVYSFETISAWERGKRNPNGQQIPRIAHLLGMTPEALAHSIDINFNSVRTRRNQEPPTQDMIEKWTSAFETWGELENIYRDRTELNRDFSYPRMFENAQEILAVGISLNAIAMNYSRAKIINSIIENKSAYHLCFLDPKGVYCAEREREEDIPQGSLADLTQLNMQNMEVVQKQISKISPDGTEQLQLLTYDLPPRFNIYVVDDSIMTVQSYAYGRGEDTPVFVLRRQSSNGLFDFYASVAKHILAQANPIGIEET